MIYLSRNSINVNLFQNNVAHDEIPINFDLSDDISYQYTYLKGEEIEKKIKFHINKMKITVNILGTWNLA